MSIVELEHVLVVPTERLHQLGYFQGFQRETARYLDHLFAPEWTSYRPRGEMEHDPSFKQLIPYVIFRHTDDAGRVSLFSYLRGNGQGERRLRSKRSVGIGGHISTLDAAHPDVYAEGMRRELAEEVEIGSPYEEACIGLINDDETDVGRVHLGVVHIFDVETPNVRPREDEILEAGFYPVSDLLADLPAFESWSQICLTALFAEE